MPDQLNLFAQLIDDAPRTQPPEGFVYGPVGRSGASAYVHLIRAPGDPERSPRGPGRALLWRQLGKHSVSEWAARILELLADGEPRTFNRIMVELADFGADTGFGENPDHALWHLVEQRKLVLTLEAPIFFKRATALPTPVTPWSSSTG
jgi:hypothetical protein